MAMLSGETVKPSGKFSVATFLIEQISFSNASAPTEIASHHQIRRRGNQHLGDGARTSDSVSADKVFNPHEQMGVLTIRVR